MNTLLLLFCLLSSPAQLNPSSYFLLSSSLSGNIRLSQSTTKTQGGLSAMNPCAGDFTPLSTPDIQSSSSVTTLGEDEDVGSSGSAAIRFQVPESNKAHEAVDPLSYECGKAYSSLQIPFLSYMTPYASFPFGFQFGAHQGWSVHPWYNPVIVSGHDCGTSPQPLHGPASFSPMNPFLSHMASLQSLAGASPEVVTERPSTSKPVPGRPLGKDQAPEESAQDKLRSDIKRKDVENLVSGLKPLACASSSARRCAIGNHSNGMRETTNKTRGKSASVPGSTRDLCYHERCQPAGLSVHLIPSLPSSVASAFSSSPLWSESTLPLMDEGPSTPDVLSLDTLKLSDSIPWNSSSLSNDSHSLRQLPHLRGTCRNVSSPACLQQWSLLSTKARQVSERGVVESSTHSPKALEDSSQDIIRSLPMADMTASKQFESTAAINTPDPGSPPSYAKMRFVAKDEPGLSSMKTPGQRSSEPCTSTIVRTQQDTQPQNSTRLEPSRKRLTPYPDNDSRSGAFPTPSNKGAFSTFQTPANANSVRNATESGSWSQSKRWMSQTSKERMIFQKTVTNLFHLSANNSPFVPQSPAELTAFRAEMADIRKKRLSREVGWRVATIERKRARSKDTDEEAAKLVPLLLGRQFRDALSPVFASRNCFAEHICQDDTEWVPWPSLPEFKDEGDKRSLKHGRRFPLPRLGINTRPMAIMSDHGCNAPWQMKTVKIDTRFIHPASDFADEPDFSYEPPLTEYGVPYYLVEAIQAMEEELDD